MSTDERIKKYVKEALESKTNTKAWIIEKDFIPKVVAEFKRLCPSIKHEVNMDWDDDTLLWLRFTWEPGTLHSTPQPVVSKTVQTVPSATDTERKSETKKQPDPPRVRYGGPRW